jgi:hypothetical protein
MKMIRKMGSIFDGRQSFMDTFAMENLLEDMQTISTCLEQLRRMDSATMPSTESIAAYHRTLEAAYVAFGRIETVIDEICEQLEAEHRRLDAALTEFER